jgi:hypothetical protein
LPFIIPIRISKYKLNRKCQIKIFTRRYSRSKEKKWLPCQKSIYWFFGFNSQWRRRRIKKKNEGRWVSHRGKNEISSNTFLLMMISIRALYTVAHFHSDHAKFYRSRLHINQRVIVDKQMRSSGEERERRR